MLQLGFKVRLPEMQHKGFASPILNNIDAKFSFNI